MPTAGGEVESEPVTITAADGFALAGDLWRPAAGGERAAVVVNSATAVVRRYYAPFARHLAGKGFAVLTYDYRGIGGSRPASLRGFGATMAEWARCDVAGALAYQRSRFPEHRRFAVGHSFGGQAIAFAPGAAELDGAVLVASQSGYWRHWPGASRLRMAFYWYVLFPLVARLVGHLPGRLGIGEDLPLGVALDWSRWGRHPDYVFGHLADAAALAASFRAPLLALSFADDGYAPRRSVEALLARFTGTAVEHRHLEPREARFDQIGHFGFFRPSHRALWPLVDGWLRGR